MAEPSRRRLSPTLLAAIFAAIAVAALVALLVNIFTRKQEAQNPFYRVVELTETTEDPAVWGQDFPLQYDQYLRTVDQVRTKVRRQRSAAAHADAGRSALGSRALAPRA